MIRMGYVCDNDNCEEIIDLLTKDHLEITVELPRDGEILEYYYCSIKCTKEDIVRELDKME